MAILIAAYRGILPVFNDAVAPFCTASNAFCVFAAFFYCPCFYFLAYAIIHLPQHVIPVENSLTYIWSICNEMSLITKHIKNEKEEVNSISCFSLVHLQALQDSAGWFHGLSKTLQCTTALHWQQCLLNFANNVEWDSKARNRWRGREDVYESEIQGETVEQSSVSHCTMRTAPLTDCHHSIKLHVGKRHEAAMEAFWFL